MLKVHSKILLTWHLRVLFVGLDVRRFPGSHLHVPTLHLCEHVTLYNDMHAILHKITSLRISKILFIL